MSETDPEMQLRQRQSGMVLANPEDFKVCEACGSIARTRAPLCPACNGYRFNADAAHVVARVYLIGARPSTTPTFD